MKQGEKKLFEIKKSFFKELETIYTPKELEVLFFLLLEKKMQITKIAFHIHPEKKILPPLDWQNALQRLKNQEPIEYILGECVFLKNILKVSRDVLIPRPETEELVLWVLENIKDQAIRILDLATGSGCIAISIKKEKPKTLVTAIDFSKGAIAICRENAMKHGIEIEWLIANILQTPNKPPHKKFDIVISNPPYVPRKEQINMGKNVVSYEPHFAIFVPDKNPLIFYQTIAKNCRDFYLKKGGKLFVEIHNSKAEEVKAVLAAHRFLNITLREDSFGRPRMIQATLL